MHIWGFGLVTLVIYCLLKRSLSIPWPNPVAVFIVIISAGLGVGAFNEIAEFVVSATVPESGVGDYINTSLDLCADFVGAIFGLLYIEIQQISLICRYMGVKKMQERRFSLQDGLLDYKLAFVTAR